MTSHGSAGTPAVPEGSGESKTPRQGVGQSPTCGFSRQKRRAFNVSYFVSPELFSKGCAPDNLNKGNVL